MVDTELHLEPVRRLLVLVEHETGVVDEHVESILLVEKCFANARIDAKLARSSAMTSTSALPLRLWISSSAAAPAMGCEP